MKITVKITNYTPKPAKKTKSATMKKYLAMTANERGRYEQIADNRLYAVTHGRGQRILQPETVRKGSQRSF